MIRSELAARIAQQNPHLTAAECETIVRTVLNTISEALVQGDRVELRGFGAFEARRREACAGRNPRNGQAVEVEARTAIHFKSSKAIHARLNRKAFDPKHKGERPLRVF